MHPLLIDRNFVFSPKFLRFFSTFWFFFSEILMVFFRKLRPTFPNVFVAWRVCKWFWHATQGSNQARHETLWLVHHRLLKKRDPNEARHKCRGYTRGSKARQVFPSTLSFSPCLGFPWWECTAGIMKNVTNKTNKKIRRIWSGIALILISFSHFSSCGE